MNTTKILTSGERAREMGLTIQHVYDREHPWGGFTLIYGPSNPGIKGKMLDIAVAHCSVSDNYNKRVGIDIAFNNFVEGRFISLPVASTNEEATHFILEYMFNSALHFAD